MSLSDVYEIGTRHALANIKQNGGKVNGDQVEIKLQVPVAVRFEKSFDGLYPIKTIPVVWSADKTELKADFEGTGFVIKGDASKWGSESTFVFRTELYVDDKLIESPELPESYTTRRYDVCWKYQLPAGKHTVRLKILNPGEGHELRVSGLIVYGDKAVNGLEANAQKR
jgi:hypothetical protein